jgi:hypothetical protein
MQLTTSPVGPSALPSSDGSRPAPPERWNRFWKTPIARVEYGEASRVPLWPEAALPADRGITGALRPSLTWGGTSLELAIEAARMLAREPVELSFSFRNGRTRTTQVHPAIAVLRDSRAGAFWLAPLHTTVRHGSEWRDAPHAVDGPAFEGSDPVLRTPRVLTATRDMVAVVGAKVVVRPERWVDAPFDAQTD